LELLRAEKISGDTPVWRKGLADWQPLRTTHLGAHLEDSPPPVAPTHVNNSLVWTLAIAPIGYAILTGWRDAEIMENPYGDHSFAQFVSLGVPLVLNAAFCLFDERQLKRAGYADKWLTLEFFWPRSTCFYVRSGCGSFRAMGSCGSPALSFLS
jgi:GYF domain 2